jgi:hypothetical protein
MLQGNVALFSHGQFGCALTARWIGLTVSEGRLLRLTLPHSAGSAMKRAIQKRL